MNRIVAVTGSARGIGRVIALAFARSGARVFVCDRDSEGASRTVDEIRTSGGQAVAYVVDLSRPGSARRMIEDAVAQAGRIDVLVNNARAGRRAALEEENEESWDEVMTVTLKAAFFASQAAISAMSRTQGGSIVNIGSIAAFVAANEAPSYHVAKAGIVQMTRYLAARAGPLGVRVNCVCPGFIVQDEHQPRFYSAQNDRFRETVLHCLPVGRVGSSADVAQAVMHLCSPEAGFITGQSLILDGGQLLIEHFGLLMDFQAPASGKGS